MRHQRQRLSAQDVQEASPTGEAQEFRVDLAPV